MSACRVRDDEGEARQVWSERGIGNQAYTMVSEAQSVKSPAGRDSFGEQMPIGKVVATLDAE